MIKVKTFYLAISFLTVILQDLCAQEFSVSGEDYFQIYSPNTFALARYGDIPTDYSTGVPNVSVPLMSVADRDICVDISLSYHATGIKVDQEATWVGLGWSLNAGGMITVEHRDKVDRLSDSLYYKRTSIPDYDYKSPLGPYLNTASTKVGSAVSSNGSDNEPDIFYYNFCGRTGKFIFDNEMHIRLLKYEDIKVEFVHGNVTYFVITDEKGIKYAFEEVTEPNVWYLTKISSPVGGEVTFTYQRIGLVADYYKLRACSVFFMELHQTYLSHGIDGMKQCPAYRLTSTFDDTMTPVAVKSITSGSGHYVEFILSNELRKDSETSNRALDRIVFYKNGAKTFIEFSDKKRNTNG